MTLQSPLIVFFCLFSSVFGFCENDDCVINESPRESIVARLNDTVTMSCGIYNIFDEEEAPYIVFNDTSTSEHTDPEDLASDYGVIGTVCTTGMNARCTTTIKVKTTEVFSIHCQVGFCCTTQGYVYGVNGIPDPPGAPLVEMISTLSLNISWNSPWSYPVNNYTLIITNNSTGLIEDMLTLNNTYYIMHKPENLSCEDVYLFSVLANTDLGPTNASQPTSATFLSDLDDLLADNYEFINDYITYECGAKKPTFQVNGNAPDLCPHETLFYSFNSMNRNGPLIITPVVTTPIFYFQNEGICDNGRCDLWETIVVNEVNQTRRFNESFDLSRNRQTVIINNITHPLTTVALFDTNVTFTCSMEGQRSKESAIMALIVNGVVANGSEEGSYLVESSKEGYSITLTAEEDNNNTKIQCFLSPCFTEEANLIVVESPPNAVGPAVINTISDNSLLISWNPPWVHPVNMYYLLVVDYSMGGGAGVVIGNYAIEGTQYWLNNSNGFECSILSVTVQAVTDVATTSPSNETRRPFYKGLKNTQVIISTKEYGYIEGTRRILNITFEAPPVCDHERLKYVFKLKDLQPPNNEVTKDSGGNSSVMIELSNYLFHDNVIMVSVEVNVSDGYSSTVIQLYENITETAQRAEPGLDSNNINSVLPVLIPSVACGLMAVVILGLVLVICVSCYWYRKVVRAKRGRIVGTVIDDGGLNFSLPPMVVNAQYSTAEEALYETINDMIMEPYATVAPQLPPPRPLSQKLTDLSLSKDDPSSELEMTTKKLEEEYVQMNGKKPDSPRYVQAPTLGNTRPSEEDVSADATETSTSFNFESNFHGTI